MKRRCGIAEQPRRDTGLGELGDVSHRLLPDGGLEKFRHQRTAVSDHGDVLKDAVGGRVPGDQYGLAIQNDDSLSEGRSLKPFDPGHLVRPLLREGPRDLCRGSGERDRRDFIGGVDSLDLDTEP